MDRISALHVKRKDGIGHLNVLFPCHAVILHGLEKMAPVILKLFVTHFNLHSGMFNSR